ncbi:hypothetical protein [Shewanella algae]|uniref:hypothetical protein n=1 Tax=Shewanella algae TaxID=38313 RepID=UPI00399B9303
MILLQLSAGTGPIECCRAVALAVQTIERECQAQGIGCELLEVTQANAKTSVACFKSVLLQLSANDEARGAVLAGSHALELPKPLQARAQTQKLVLQRPDV